MSTMFLISTVKSVYLCEKYEEVDGSIKMTEALVIDPYDSTENQATAYITGKILGKVRSVTLKSANVESMEEAEDQGPLVQLMKQYLPLAEKNAKARAIVRELHVLINSKGKKKHASDDDDSDDDDDDPKPDPFSGPSYRKF